MNPTIKQFWIGIGVWLAGLPILALLAVFALGDILSASPTHKPGEPILLGGIGLVWFSGTFLTRMPIDYLVFGGPMPPEGSKTDNPPNNKQVWDRYHQEETRRETVYIISWLASPLWFGLGSILISKIRKEFKQRKRDSGSRLSSKPQKDRTTPSSESSETLDR